MTTALPAGVRSIVTALSVEYRKKARGVLIAESRVTVPAVDRRDRSRRSRRDPRCERRRGRDRDRALASESGRMTSPPDATPSPSRSAASGTALDTALTRQAHIEVPLICGAMYPCSNPELVAAVSEAGGIGIVQPISMTFVHRHEFRAGLKLIRDLTAKPIGMNALIEKSSRLYSERMERWVDVAIEEGVRFFVTSLGNPRWVAERVHAVGGFVYHDVTEAKWAAKGRDGGVDGLIAVNRRAGGHAGERSAEALLEELAPFGLPVVCAGGIGDGAGFAAALRMGYAGVQMGTRFIATPECRAERVVQAGDRGGARGGRGADRTPDRNSGRGSQYAVHPAHRHARRAVRTLDAARTTHQALDALDLRAQVGVAPEARRARSARSRANTGRRARAWPRSIPSSPPGTSCARARPRRAGRRGACARVRRPVGRRGTCARGRRPVGRRGACARGRSAGQAAKARAARRGPAPGRGPVPFRPAGPRIPLAARRGRC